MASLCDTSFLSFRLMKEVCFTEQSLFSFNTDIKLLFCIFSERTPIFFPRMCWVHLFFDAIVSIRLPLEQHEQQLQKNMHQTSNRLMECSMTVLTQSRDIGLGMVYQSKQEIDGHPSSVLLGLILECSKVTDSYFQLVGSRTIRKKQSNLAGSRRLFITTQENWRK